MERMTVNFVNDEVKCVPNTIHVPKFCTEDILLLLHDDIVDSFDFAKKAITFENNNYGKRFTQVRLNDKTIWLHDNNTPYHVEKEKAKFTLSIREQGKNKNKSLDPEVVNE